MILAKERKIINCQNTVTFSSVLNLGVKTHSNTNKKNILQVSWAMVPLWGEIRLITQRINKFFPATGSLPLSNLFIKMSKIS